MWYINKRVSNDLATSESEFILMFFLPIVVILVLVLLISMIFIFSGKIRDYFRRISLSLMKGSDLAFFTKGFISMFIIINLFNFLLSFLILSYLNNFLDQSLEIFYLLLGFLIPLSLSIIISLYVKNHLEKGNLSDLIRG